MMVTREAHIPSLVSLLLRDPPAPPNLSFAGGPPSFTFPIQITCTASNLPGVELLFAKSPPDKRPESICRQEGS